MLGIPSAKGVATVDLERQIKKEFLRVLHSEEFVRKFQHLKARSKILRLFGTPVQMQEFLHDKNDMDYRLKDCALRALMIEHRAAHADDLTIYLIGLLMPGLRRVFSRLRAKTDGLEADELWSQIITFCLEHIEKYNFTRRPQKIAKNIVMDTFNSTLKWLKREQNYYNAKCPFEGTWLIERLSVEHCFDGGEACQLAPGEVLALLVKRGVVSVDNLYLIFATSVKGKTLRALAAELDQNYETVRKRHYRTAQAILGFLRGGDK